MQIQPTPKVFSTKGLQLFTLGFLILFLELSLIRWLGGNIWNLSYFPNLVLITVFVGMGLGFTFHHLIGPRLSQIFYHLAFFILLGLISYVYFFHPTVPGFETWQGDLGGDLYFTATPQTAVDQSYLPFVIYMCLLVTVFGLISQRMAKLFREFKPLSAYTLDIAGSCTGILAFMLISWLSIPAVYWFIVFALIALIPAADSIKTRFIPLLPCLGIVFFVFLQDSVFLANPDHKGAFEVHWSPYQKVEYINVKNYPPRIFVNGVNHQHMETNIPQSYYQIIHNDRMLRGYKPSYKNALILGAGSGSDVSAALYNGAEHVDAVEIDPVIAGLGKKYNPNKPYQDKRVNLTIDDGRAFMTQTDRTYDLIIFALTDSLVKVSSMAQLRLENYLFTLESVQRAYDLLSPGGDLVFYNFYRKPWLKEKIEGMLKEVSGSDPREVFKRGDFAVLSVSKNDNSTHTNTSASDIELPRDDWPFLYLKNRGMPGIYTKAMIGMTVFVLLLTLTLHLITRKTELYATKGLTYIKLAFVFMGIAFLLLETKSVIQFSLLFGTTWLNNSLVFFSVLLLILAANWTAWMMKNKKWIWFIFVLLISSTLVTFVFPFGNLLSVENVFFRFVFASILTFSPIFFANLVFAITFRDQMIAEHIFGWNLIGATLGGVMEYFSMAYGYNFLALIVALCYTLVLIFIVLAHKRSSKSSPLQI